MTVSFKKPANPGTYIQYVSERTQRPAAAVAATVGIPVVHDWGPLGSEEGPVRLNDFSEWEAQFGDSASDARDAVLGAFMGPGIDAVPGCGSVIVYRMGATGVLRATKNLSNTTPVVAIRIDAKYAGTRGNNLALTVDADPLNVANQRLRVLYNGVTAETYLFTSGVASNLAATINASSNLIKAIGPYVDGVALAAVTNQALTTGNSGTGITNGDYLNALSAFEFEPFSVFAPANITDSTMQASIATWVATMANDQRPVVAVMGGPSVETLAEAITRTALVRSEHIVSVGAGAFHDDYLGKDVSTAQLAPRIAGALAGLGEERSLTFTRFGGLRLLGAASISTDQLDDAAAAGITCFRRTSSADAELRISRGVTTYISSADPAKDPAIFGDPRLVRVADLFIRRLREWGDDNIVGQTVVSDSTKAAVRSRGDGEINSLMERGLILPGANDSDKPFFRTVDPASVGAPEDSVPFEFGWKFTKTTNYLIGNGRLK